MGGYGRGQAGYNVYGKSRVSLPGAPWWPYRNTHTQIGTGLHGELFYLSKEHL